MALVIAIDGPAASGKGTLAKRLAAHYGLPHLDTGLLYRAVARAVLADGHAVNDRAAAIAAAGRLGPIDDRDEALRSAAMGEAASVVAAVPEVRAALLQLQREFAGRPSGAVLDGRDIGTVICPRADVKLFVTASAEARADRRYREARGRGESVTYERLLDEIRARDSRDAGRAVAPLLAAADARVIDTSQMGIDEVFRVAVTIVDTFGPAMARA
ncbi:(d)CMP kinase [Chelatococcus reniformis]|uniref:Cytidylate kinase n=1 Tax=Chelatococcus reniformis TaxID=1494448 RepID=A0A916X837_9HYPH|nr:d(CMP) kinase [Chelatococcus reniformis]GGC46640.1 cytidylate kinase [Chelatococcus reniformis]